MKIAVPTKEKHVDEHFGHCSNYTIFTIEEKQITGIEEHSVPEGCSCKSVLAAQFKQQGVGVVLAGNMGEGAKNKFEAQGIEVIRGCAGPAHVAVSGYLAGALVDSGQGRHSHDGEHKCHGEGHGHCHGEGKEHKCSCSNHAK